MRLFRVCSRHQIVSQVGRELTARSAALGIRLDRPRFGRAGNARALRRSVTPSSGCQCPPGAPVNAKLAKNAKLTKRTSMGLRPRTDGIDARVAMPPEAQRAMHDSAEPALLGDLCVLCELCVKILPPARENIGPRTHPVIDHKAAAAAPHRGASAPSLSYCGGFESARGIR